MEDERKEELKRKYKELYTQMVYEKSIEAKEQFIEILNHVAIESFNKNLNVTQIEEAKVKWHNFINEFIDAIIKENGDHISTEYINSCASIKIERIIRSRKKNKEYPLD